MGERNCTTSEGFYHRHRRPPQLEEETEHEDNNCNNISFEECNKNSETTHPPSPINDRCNSRCNLRPLKPKLVATLCKNKIPTAPTINTSQDLICTNEILTRLNITYHDQSMQQDDSHLPLIDAHHTELVSQWTQLSSKTNTTSKHSETTNSPNAVYHSVTGACLYYQ